jgi:oligosaccharide 4-alpha-D-glucosyltransferase
MTRIYLWTLIFSLWIASPKVQAQQAPRSLRVQQERLMWEVVRMDSQIIRLQCLPAQYPTVHPPTDAVVLSPINFSFTKIDHQESKYRVGTNEVMQWQAGLDWTWNEMPMIEDLQYFSDSTYRGFRFRLKAGEKIFGGGGRALPMDRRGYRLPLQNNPSYGYALGADQLNFSVPFFLSSGGYGVFFDNPSIGYADIGKTNKEQMEVGFTHGAMTVYLIRGQSIGQMVEAFARLTGKQPLPPRWALGNLMSRFGYRSQKEVIETVSAMRRDDFPVDAVILDLFWFGDSIKGTMGNLDWVNKSRWPDPAGMVKQLADSSIQTVLIAEPFVLEGTRQATASKPHWAVDANGNPFVLQDFYFGKGGLIDIFHAPAQQWFWQQYQKQKKIGIGGWWGDLGEPEKHPTGVYHRLMVDGKERRYPAAAVHNIYGHTWSKLLFQQYRKHYPDERLFHLNRAGFAGSAKFSVFPWTGDVSRTWEGLQAQLPLLLGLSINGVPYIHSDAGGFAGGDGDPELYTRWLQFACFTPIFRPHGTALGDYDTTIKNIPSEPVFWPKPYRDIARNYIKERYRLLPYLYTLAWEQTVKGKPLMRPLYYHSTLDSNLYQADGQYMLGNSLMVAPVVEKGQKTKRIYFPAGNWYHYHTLEAHKGSCWDTVKLTAEHIPIYIRAGSFMPLKVREMKSAQTYLSDTLVIQYLPGVASSQWDMYNDDGHSARSLAERKYEVLHFEARETDQLISLKVKNDAGYYRGKPNRRLLVFQVPGLQQEPTALKVNGLKTPIRDRFDDSQFRYAVPFSIWDPLNRMLYVRVDAGGAGVEIEISVNGR